MERKVNGMFLRTHPCPVCHAAHGHPAWRVANSSVFKPLRCRTCQAYFHQTGLGLWLAGALVFPAGTVLVLVSGLLQASAVPLLAQWAPALSFVLALLSYMLLAAVVVNRTHPLVPGPKHG